MKKPTAIDLFSGAGGLSEGLVQAGYEVLGAVEIDSLACKTYRMNHEHTRLWEVDITRIQPVEMMSTLKMRPGELDLLAACPPCQGFSTIRTKNGKQSNQDPRNDLIFEVSRMVKAFQPKAIMLENVPLLSEDPRFHRFCNELEIHGYVVSWSIFNTADFGVPQRRKRLVLLASRVRIPVFASKATSLLTVRDCLGSLPRPETSRDPLHNYYSSRSARVEKLIQLIPRDGGSRSALGAESQLPCHKRSDGFRDVYGRMSWDKPAPTITGGCINPSKGRFLHPEENRPITLREAALLQTFPLTYKFSLERGRHPVALMIGNALPPEFIRRHAHALKIAIKES